MAVCDRCYNPVCTRNGATGPCISVDFLADLTTHRGANGNWDLNFRAELPHQGAGVGDVLLDTLSKTKLTGQVTYVPTDESVVFYNGGVTMDDPAVSWLTEVTGATPLSLYHACETFKAAPSDLALRKSVLAHLEKLVFTATTAAGREHIKQALTICTEWVKLHEKKDDLPLSAGEQQAMQCPMARLYMVLTKQCSATVELTCSFTQTSEGKFDVVAGRTFQDYETLKECTSWPMLYKIMEHTKVVLMATGANGDSLAWKPLWEQVELLAESGRSFQFLHSLIFSCLRTIDSSPTLNVVSFMATRYQVHLLTFVQRYTIQENAEAGLTPGGPHNLKGDGAPVHIRFGPVTKQGESCGEMRTKSGAVAFCNKWNQNEDCDKGVFAGVHKGKCAYCHKCRWCFSTSHRSEDKDGAGAFVCSKHN